MRISRWRGLGEAGTDAVERYGNWFGILFRDTWLNPKVQKPLSHATVLQGVSWERDLEMKVREQEVHRECLGGRHLWKGGESRGERSQDLRRKLDCIACQQRWVL